MKIQNINNDFTSEELRQYYADNTTPQSLADVYAFADRNFWCIAHDIDDYEIGTQEYEHIKSVYDEWATLVLEYEEKIFTILRDEGVEIPATDKITVLELFMMRYNYRNGSGWWIKEGE